MQYLRAALGVQSIGLGVVDKIFLASSPLAIGGAGALGIIYSLGVIIPSLAVGTRRLHDIDRSGWWQLIVLVPFIGVIVLIVLFAKVGNAGDNKYGLDPKSTWPAIN